MYKSHPAGVYELGIFKFKGFFSGNPSKRGDSLKLDSWPRCSLYVHCRPPSVSAASKGLQDRKNTTHQIEEGKGEEDEDEDNNKSINIKSTQKQVEGKQ